MCNQMQIFRSTAKILGAQLNILGAQVMMLGAILFQKKK